MKTVLIVIAAISVIYILWWWFVARNLPAVPPISISEDDPLMKNAKKQARDSLPQFRALFIQYPTGARVKIPFKTNSDQTEFLWGEVRKFDDHEIEVLYITPPVTHTGKLERIHTHPSTDIADWVIKLPNGNYLGGFSMRVMFQRGREQWGSLPPHLAAEERKYVDR